MNPLDVLTIGYVTERVTGATMRVWCGPEVFTVTWFGHAMWGEDANAVFLVERAGKRDRWYRSLDEVRAHMRRVATAAMRRAR
jgi:hypothetical protein